MKSLFTLILTFALAGAMQAKAGTAENEKKAKAETGKYSQQLLLNKDQHDKLYTIALDFFNQREAIVTSKKDEAAKEKALTILKEEADTKVKAILTEEQFKNYKKLREEEKLKNGKQNKATVK